MVDLALFEKFVRTQIGSVAVNRAPTEAELVDACNMVRMMMPITDEEAEIIIKTSGSARCRYGYRHCHREKVRTMA